MCKLNPTATGVLEPVRHRAQVLCCPICKPGGNKAGPQPIAPSKYLDALKAKAEAEAANQ